MYVMYAGAVPLAAAPRTTPCPHPAPTPTLAVRRCRRPYHPPTGESPVRTTPCRPQRPSSTGDVPVPRQRAHPASSPLSTPCWPILPTGHHAPPPRRPPCGARLRRRRSLAPSRPPAHRFRIRPMCLPSMRDPSPPSAHRALAPAAPHAVPARLRSPSCRPSDHLWGAVLPPNVRPSKRGCGGAVLL